tara:strand:+ start:443 stop:976 length:534 start_codon:yes stop_codon:yes gene_type:complete
MLAVPRLRELLREQYDNITITFATLWMFCVAQSLFWIYIGSRQLDTLVAEKTGILKTFFEFSQPELRTQFCTELKASMTSQSDEERIAIEEQNFSMLQERFSTFFLVTFLAFFLSLLLSVHTHFFSDKIDTEKRYAFLMGLGLVLASFATELVIFYFIIKPYVIIGDAELFEKILYA